MAATGRMPTYARWPPIPATSRLWPSGGVHLWPSGGTSSVQSHARGHLVYAARGVLSVHTERGTSIVPANRVAWTPAGFTHYHRAHGNTDMRILFLPASLARLVPGHPAVFMASDLAREVLLTLTGPPTTTRGDQPRPRRERSPRRVLVDELHEAHEQPLQLPEPHDDRLQAIARMLYEQPGDNTSLAELGQTIGASARTLSRLFHDELGMTFYRVAHPATHLSRTRPARRRPRHDPRRPRLRLGEPQQLHRSLHRPHRHHPGPLPDQPETTACGGCAGPRWRGRRGTRRSTGGLPRGGRTTRSRGPRCRRARRGSRMYSRDAGSSATSGVPM